MKNKLLFGMLAALTSLAMLTAAACTNDEETPTPTATTGAATSPTAAPSPSGTGTPGATGTPSGTPSGTGTPRATGTPSGTPSGTGTPRATGTPSGTPVGTPSGTGTPRPTGTPSGTPSATGTPSGTPSATGTPSGTPGATGTPSGTPGAGQGLIAAIQANAQLSTLLTLIQSAGLTETLSSGDGYTIFAPTNDAFDSLPEGVLDVLESDPDALMSVLQYHVVEGSYTSEQLATMDSLTTLEGSDISIGTTIAGADAGGVVLNGEFLLQGEGAEAGNSMIFLIDGVMLPPEG